MPSEVRGLASPIAHRSFDPRIAPKRRDRCADLCGYLRTVK